MRHKATISDLRRLAIKPALCRGWRTSLSDSRWGSGRPSVVAPMASRLAAQFSSDDRRTLIAISQTNTPARSSADIQQAERPAPRLSRTPRRVSCGRSWMLRLFDYSVEKRSEPLCVNLIQPIDAMSRAARSARRGLEIPATIVAAKCELPSTT